MLASALVLFVDGWKSSAMSKRQQEIDPHEDSLDYFLDGDIEFYPDDVAYLADAIQKSYPAHSQKPASQHSYPASSNDCNKSKF